MSEIAESPPRKKDPETETERALRIVANLAEARLLAMLERICAEHGVRLEDVLSRRGRRSEVARARHAFWAEIHETRGKSYPEIGDLCDADHKTVHAGVRAHRERVTQLTKGGASCATSAP